MLDILCDVCEQHRLMGTHLASVACRTCEGTGQICVEETLPCEECRLMGEPKSSLVYQDTIGRLTVWRCRFGHVRTEAIGATCIDEPKQRICEWCSIEYTAELRRGRPSPYCSDTCRHDAKTAMSGVRMRRMRQAERDADPFGLNRQPVGRPRTG
jgi:hypothetical protein